MNTINLLHSRIFAVIPAAGIGSRMLLNIPKQYLKIQGYTILEHSVNFFLSHSNISKIIVVLNKKDVFFNTLPISSHPRVFSVFGGRLRIHSVLSGLLAISNADWVIVHDAVRPCLNINDLNKILSLVNTSAIGGILATPVSNTLKYSTNNSEIFSTINRNRLWNALTPQCFPLKLLTFCLKKVIDSGINITDESSAMEYCGYFPKLVQGCSSNIKVTYPEDISFVNCYLKSKFHERSSI
ncbi:MAG: 2-C-methyl-D-erythritol 4-phosphate cytidylyltransferase [Buchnera aphidicola (Schlechtendalia chinensis)]